MGKIISIQSDRDVNILFPNGRILRRNTVHVRPSKIQCPNIQPLVPNAPFVPPVSSNQCANNAQNSPPANQTVDITPHGSVSQSVPNVTSNSKPTGPSTVIGRSPIKLTLYHKGSGMYSSALQTEGGNIRRSTRLIKPVSKYQAK